MRILTNARKITSSGLNLPHVIMHVSLYQSQGQTTGDVGSGGTLPCKVQTFGAIGQTGAKHGEKTHFANFCHQNNESFHPLLGGRFP